METAQIIKENKTKYLKVLMKEGQNRTQIIAHRGAWKMKKLPQNSIASLQQAIDGDFYAAEFDVQLTKDGVLVVNHDDTFYGMEVATSTYADLLSQSLPNGEKIPTAEEYLNYALKENAELRLIYEIKSSILGTTYTKRKVEHTVQLIKKLKVEKKVEFILFDFESACYLTQLEPSYTVAYLMGDKTPEEVKEAGIQGIDYHYNIYKENPDWIEEAKTLGLSTNAWTVNQKEEIEILIQKKIDFITTDEPELAESLLKR